MSADRQAPLRLLALEPSVVASSPVSPARRLTRLAVLAAVPVLFVGCDWFTDFKDQPRIEPWESYGFANGTDSMSVDTIPFRGNPQGSVPITGIAVSQFQVSYRPFPNVIDSVAAVVGANPIPMDERSLANGHRYYQVNCATCHGDTGLGNGRATLFGMVGISVVSPMAQGYSDGYIFGIIRNGRGLMPTYNRIEENDRWDVVNYLRALQGRSGGLPVATGPLGYPGENGNTVPRYTETAPTRPSPYVKPSGFLRLPDGSSPVPVRNGERIAPLSPPVGDSVPGITQPSAQPAAPRVGGSQQ